MKGSEISPKFGFGSVAYFLDWFDWHLEKAKALVLPEPQLNRVHKGTSVKEVFMLYTHRVYRRKTKRTKLRIKQVWINLLIHLIVLLIRFLLRA